MMDNFDWVSFAIGCVVGGLVVLLLKYVIQALADGDVFW